MTTARFLATTALVAAIAGAAGLSTAYIASGFSRTIEPGVRPTAQSTDRSFKAEPPRFSDGNRRAKLATAFPEIDRLVRQFMAQRHVPGAAWGVVIDGELAHSGAAGFRDVTTKAAVDADTSRSRWRQPRLRPCSFFPSRKHR